MPRLEERGLTTVRETVRWHLVEPSEGHFDFRTLEPMVETAKRHRLQILWTLCHYGWPDGLDLLSASFVEPIRRVLSRGRIVLERTERQPATGLHAHQ